LSVTSNFTFLTGASHPDELVERAADLGHAAASIADTNTLAGVVRAHVAAKRAGVPLLVGCRLALSDAPAVLVYPTGREGYAGLCRLLTLGKRRAPKGECHLSLHDLVEHEAGLLAIVEPPGVLDEGFVEVVRGLRGVFDDGRLSIAGWHAYRGEDGARLEQIAALGAMTRVPMVATNRVLLHDASRRALQDVLTCIRFGCTVEEAGLRLEPNAERRLKPAPEMAGLFAAFPGAVERTAEIAARASGFSLDQLRYEYPVEACPRGMSPAEFLRARTMEGAAWRYPGGVPEKVRAAIEHELGLIAEMGYEAYFLTCDDIVRFARGRGILCQGRGGAANSAVCYCLGITAVDPATHSLLFERFISRERGEPPDIDIDFEHERREEVIQYLYAKYGRDRAALTAEVISYRGRSAVREVGKAMGLPLDCVDTLAKNLDRWGEAADDRRVREIGLNPDDPTIRRVIDLSRELVGFPRHLSQHVGGFVITRRPLSELVPIENAAMEDRTVIEWDKDDIDAMGMLKVDCLGLGMLSCIRRALEMIKGGEIQRQKDEETGRGFGEVSPRGTGIAERGADAARTGDLVGNDPRGRRAWGLARRDRSGAAGPDQEPGEQAGLISRGASSGRLCVSSPPIAGDLYSFYARIASGLSDPAVYDMICAADTVGVFQIESRAQMSMLPRLRPRVYYDLVIEVAIVRPGPIQGGMVHPYLRRRQGLEPVSYPRPEVEAVLGRTLGVPLFQEQAMQLAIVAAGFTPDQADGLRRAMAAWKRRGNAIHRYGTRLVEGMLERGYPREFAERCFEQIKGFSEYGFPESHAASFAILVYVSAWLKRYHPAAFAAALINSQPMGFYAPAQIVRDAAEHGVEVRGVDVNRSGWDCRLEARDGETTREDARGEGGVPESGRSGPALRLGMRLVKGIGEAEAGRIEGAVGEHGAFATVGALWRASGVSVRTLRALARADAFASMGLDRQRALWQIRALRDDPMPLFDGVVSADEPGGGARDGLDRLPEIPAVHRVLHDYDAVGLSLKAHPVSFIRDRLERMGVVPTGDLRSPRLCPGKREVRVAGLVICRQRPGTASGVVFVTLEDETGIANLIVWPDVFERFRRVARLSTLLLARGMVERQGEVVHVHVAGLESLDGQLNGLESVSRDFH
jgi:error-prone DNA polymerase